MIRDAASGNALLYLSYSHKDSELIANWLVIRSDRFPLSVRLNRRVPPLAILLTSLILIVMILSVGYGEYPISRIDVEKTILGWTAAMLTTTLSSIPYGSPVSSSPCWWEWP